MEKNKKKRSFRNFYRFHSDAVQMLIFHIACQENDSNVRWGGKKKVVFSTRQQEEEEKKRKNSTVAHSVSSHPAVCEAGNEMEVLFFGEKKITWISSHFVFDFLFFSDSSNLYSENSQTKAKPREVAVIPKLNRDYSSAKQEVVSGGEEGPAD